MKASIVEDLGRKVIVSVINDLVTDQRVKKVCGSLHEMGFKLVLVGRRMHNSLRIDARPYPVRRMRLLFEKGPLFYVCFQIRLFIFLLFHKCDLLISNDLDTLLPNYLVSKLKRIPLVYDSHEYFTGVPELENNNLKRKIWKLVERWIFPGLKDVFTVNESIADLYAEEYGIRPVVIRNVPQTGEEIVKKSRASLSMPEDKKIMILQGSGINIRRGAEEMVEAMRFIENAVLFIVGGGDVINILKEKVKQWHLEQKVLFKPRQPYETLMQYTAATDLGLSLDMDTNINYRFSLPNKIFDYLHAGIPVLASDLVEIRKIIDTYQVGDFIPDHEPQHIAQKVNEIFSRPEKLMQWRQNTRKAAHELSWENESKILKKIYAKYV